MINAKVVDFQANGIYKSLQSGMDGWSENSPTVCYVN